MHENADPQGTLFALQNGVNSAGFTLTPLEKSVAKAVQTIINLKPDDFMAPALGELAMDLATNIAKGNIKGRAIANEAQQLATVLEQLRGEDATEDGAHLPQGVIDFVSAMQSRPAQPTPVRDAKDA